ncbi:MULTISPECIES: hypothetical protein [Kitasatospora]|uniref:Uncharacterized protein n=2 Tax=Kitasatospora TaxID=2063 RepID=A0ABT1ISF2_9ACTN|nr:hypothetical protein [Kitasatospora paracochleata]MCP2308037.1 hypothetical protein [Kitasatospora paracochleata]
MTREWRTGSIELVDGYALLDGEGREVRRLAGIEFAVEGGYLNVRVPGRDGLQLLSAPAVRSVRTDG